MTSTRPAPSSTRRSLLAQGLGSLLGASGGLSALGAPQWAFAQASAVRGGQLLIGSPSRPRHFNPALMSGSPMMPAAQLFALAVVSSLGFYTSTAIRFISYYKVDGY